jgi:DnaJ-class molecular chaperone
MSIEEARMILGVTASATPDEIHAAWREQMKRNHPDQGGSTFIAARINEAKSVLLGE